MANLNIVIDILANDRASGPLGRITGAMQGFGSGVQRAGQLALTAAGGAITALGAGFLFAGKTAIGMNSVLETSTLQFETLMGDADRAEEHVRSLFEFAKATPFETGPIIEASRMLQTFGGDALNSMENLTLVGDAAAATSAPIEGLGFWVGRLYSNLQGGQPFGEAAMRLQELAVLSPEARQQMEDLQAAGASADEVFAVFQENLGGFAGAMEKQAGTWQGLKSTISDAIGILSAQTLAPFFELAKTGLGGVAAALSDPRIAEGSAAIASALSGLIAGLGDGQGILAVRDFVYDLATAFGMSRGAAYELTVQIESVWNWLVALATQIQTALQPVTDWIANNVTLSDVLIGLGVAIGTVVVPAVIGLIGSVLAIAAPVAAVILAVAGLRAAWETDFGGIRDFAAGIWLAIQQAFGAFKLLFAGDWDGFLTEIDTAWQTAWTAVTEFLGNLWDMALPYLTGWWDSVKLWFEETDWRALAITLIETLVTGLVDFWLLAGETIAGWYTSIVTWAGTVDWAAVGRAVVTGIANGISAAAQFVKDALNAAIDAAIAAVKDKLGIESPSRVTAEIIGRPLAQGVGVGWQRELSGFDFGRPLAAAMPTPGGGTVVSNRTEQRRVTIYGGLHLGGVDNGQQLLRELNRL